jgi:hypothetical protein
LRTHRRSGYLAHAFSVLGAQAYEVRPEVLGVLRDVVAHGLIHLCTCAAVITE